MRIVLLNGPNLNLLGKRHPEIYGTRSMEQVLLDIQFQYPELYLKYHQSNHEGDLIDWIQAYGMGACCVENAASHDNLEIDGIILNAGGYTHTSVALRDAVACTIIPVVEIHISDITIRESFRRVSLLTDVCAHSIIGQGVEGYLQAIEWIVKQKNNKNNNPK